MLPITTPYRKQLRAGGNFSFFSALGGVTVETPRLTRCAPDSRSSRALLVAGNQGRFII